ncbi:MAG: 1-acyl-sn-glycerol-3-phosphate acyltransferase [Silicimonas sp.]|nr:1-acyl-sn-glycerol-3-phosphate acyltransferase [Silicimonas sp.]
MFETVAIPVWAFILIGLFAAISILERVIGPSIRWFFRKRAERVVAELNKRLDRPIQPFKLARRYDMIQRLIHDGEVAHAIVDHARNEGIPEEVAREKAARYAREIVPRFSATAYFGFGTRAAKWISDTLFHVQVGETEEDVLTGIDPDATVVFVMNHRSNMDYLLVTWLAARSSALSYAAGEWARVWPLSALVRTMGAYFIRRKQLNPLYRKVMARYIQMATDGGVTQAVFPEGGLSLDGRLAPLKLGLLSYLVAGFRPERRDIVFVPVALNYDRVLEDRILLDAGQAGTRRFRASFSNVTAFILRQLLHRLRGRLYRFGHAAVAYGPPLSLKAFAETHPEDTTEALGEELRARLSGTIPVLPVPLMALVLEDAQGPLSEAELAAAMADRLTALRAAGARLHMPSGELSRATAAAVKRLELRRLITVDETGIAIAPDRDLMMGFYANSIRHLGQTGDQ